MKPLAELIRTADHIKEHLETLAVLANGLDVVEIGFRTGDSATAFLQGCKSLISIDINQCKTDGFVETGKFRLLVGDSKKVEPIASDLLFIDGNHDYDYVISDLERFGSKARKYIALHDSARPKAAGVRIAVFTWLANNHNWRVVADRTNCEGLMILERFR